MINVFFILLLLLMCPRLLCFSEERDNLGISKAHYKHKDNPFGQDVALIQIQWGHFLCYQIFIEEETLKKAGT